MIHLSAKHESGTPRAGRGRRAHVSSASQGFRQSRRHIQQLPILQNSPSLTASFGAFKPLFLMRVMDAAKLRAAPRRNAISNGPIRVPRPAKPRALAPATLSTT